MKNIEHKLRKTIIVLAALSMWLYWDLSQAHSTMMTVYRSFFFDSEVNAVSVSTATVAIVRSNDSALGTDTCGVTSEAITYTTISKMVKRAVELACGPDGLRSFIKSGDTVLIKPNLVQQDSSGSGGITDVRVVKALVYLVDSIDHGHIKIIVGDGSPRPYTSFEKSIGPSSTAWVQLYDVSGYQQLKTEALASQIDFRLSNLNGNDPTELCLNELELASVPGGGNAQPQNGQYYIHRDVLHASVYITVPVMKTHQQPGYTGALKNQIGLAPSTIYGFSKNSTSGGSNKKDGINHHLDHYNLMKSTWHNWQDKEIVDLATIARIKFSLIDAITCLDSNKSPHYSADKWNAHISNRIKLNTVLASYDPVAVDNVCCRIMGLNPDDIEHITLAERKGLGTNNTDHIIIAGASIDQTKKLFRKSQVTPFSGGAGTTNIGIYGQGNRTWLLSNYFPASGISNPMDSAFISNETALAPTAGNGGWSQPLYFIEDQILLNDYYTTLGSQSAVSYAFTYLSAPAAQQAELWIGSDEAVKIYLNGSVVYNYAGTRSFDGNECYKEIATMNLQKGINRLLVKSYQSIGKYTFSVNICEVQSDPMYKGNRVSGLKFLSSGSSTSVHEKSASTISTFELKHCYPNPFNPTTTIEYQVPGIGKRFIVSLKIFDMLGREVTTLVHEEKTAGTYSVAWNASNSASGVYFYKLTAGNFSQVKKMMLMK
jgi:uncharacterized protein (DUF362 family)